MSLGVKQMAKVVGQPLWHDLELSSAAARPTSCYVDGQQVQLSTPIKYPVLAGGIAVRSGSDTAQSASMVQLMPMKIDKVGAAQCCPFQRERFEMADDAQVYLWYKGQYYYHEAHLGELRCLLPHGWYDNFGCAAGKTVRIIVAVKKD